ncbi:MAG: DnaD domain protein [Ruminococcaceae bacterium]|nr:DnaD domain protein [Oscillospiraceae bacterium]
MKLTFTYGNGALVLPAALAQHIDKASKKDLRILLALAAEPMAKIDLEAACDQLAKALSLTAREIELSLSFWRGTGILQTDESEAAPVALDEERAPAPAPKVIADKGLPVYSSEELSGVLERRAELATLVNECQRTFGKIFNANEVSVIAGLVDYLGLDGEYILLLLAHCVRIEKKSLRYVEKTAISLHDEGILEVKALEERLHRIEVMASAIGKIRGMFGISSRALTTKEKTMVENWVCGMRYSEEILKMAYEITVDTIGKASITYANSILERWHAAGYRTTEDVQSALAAYRSQKGSGQGSFDVDDFFEAALKRTYGE